MKIEQINHWLTKVFVVALVLLSGLVFVTSRAAFNNIHQLPIQFILENDSFVAGEQVLLQAIIDGDHDFNSVYFIIRDENQALELQFQAYLENNNIWAADSTWDTTNVIPGGYYLSATATAYGSDGTIMEFASSNDHLFTIIENTSVPPEEEEEEETDTPPLNDPQIDPLVVANIVYPVTQSIISGNNAPLEVILNRSLQDTEVLGASLYNIDGNLMEDHQLSVSSSDNLIYQGHLGNTTQYEDGDYYVVFWLDAATNYLTDPIVFVIQNQEEEEEEETTVPPEEEEENNSGAVTDPIDYAITLEQPSTTIIENNDLIIQLFTNFIAADVGFLFTKADDPSIGVEFSLQNIDGQHWSQVITLDNTFINGDYILTVISIDANGVVFQEIFNFVVNLPILDPPEDNGVSQFFINDYDFADVACYQTYEQSVDPEDWTIGVEALSGEVSELSEMYTLNDVYNEFRITYTSDTAMEVVMYVCNPSSPAFGTGAIFEISANHDNEPHFMWELPASSQPSTFCNWNCGDIEEGVPEEDQDENADPNVPQPEDDGDDNQEEGDDVPEEDEPISCQTDVDCVNLCSGCYHQDDAPVIDCAGLPYGDCSCVEGQCTHIDSNDDPEIEVMDNVDIDQFCLDAGIENESDCAHWLAMLSGDIDQLCLAENIYDATACEDYLNRTYVDLECQEEQIVDPQACEDYLLEKYSFDVACQLESEYLCQEILQDDYLNRLVIKQQKKQSISTVMEPLIGQSISTQNLIEQLAGVEVVDAVPLINDNNLFIISSEESITLVNEQRLEVVSPAVLMIDTDSDGLPDDLEAYYGTDIFNSDSDSDGYLDGQEISNNYNPLGDGNLDIDRTNLDQIILTGANLEQPILNADRLDENITIVETDNETEESSLTWSGQADANAWVLIYIYSDLPLVLTTQADANGNWSYALDENLTDGQHQAYVTINDETGKIVKQSNPLSFFVRSAQAVSAGDYFSAQPPNSKVDNMLLYYLLGGAALIVLSLGVIIFIHRGKDDPVEEL